MMISKSILLTQRVVSWYFKVANGCMLCYMNYYIFSVPYNFDCSLEYLWENDLWLNSHLFQFLALDDISPHHNITMKEDDAENKVTLLTS